MLERKAAVRAVGVDHGAGGGQLVLTFVVIGDDEVDAERGGERRFLHAGDAAVDRDDQRHAGLGKCADGVTAEAVALLDAAGNVHRHIRPARAEIIGQKAGRGDTVHVVVAEDRQLFAVFKRLRDARDGLVHVLQEHGVERALVAAAEKGARLHGVSIPAQGQQHRQQRRVARAQQCLRRLRRRVWNLPVAVFHKCNVPRIQKRYL